MRNRTNLFCATGWAFSSGIYFGIHGIGMGIISLVVAAMYFAQAFESASKLDKKEKNASK